MPHVKFSYPTGKHKAGDVVYLSSDEAQRRVTDGVATVVDSPAPEKKTRKATAPKPTPAKPTPKPSE